MSKEDETLFLLRDAIFKSMFIESSDFRDMLNDIFVYYFDLSIKDYELYDKEISIQNKKDHQNEMDIFLKSKDNKYLLDMEVNVGSKSKYLNYYSNRNLVYICKIVMWLFNDDRYKKELKTIQININDIYCPLDEEVISSSMILYDIKNNIKDERMTIHNLYLARYKKLHYNKLTEIEKDLALLVADDIEKMKILAKGNSRRESIMSKYSKKISDKELFDILFDPEREQRQYEITMQDIIREEVEKEVRSEILEAKANSAKENSIEIAKEMLKMNIPIEQIAKITKLTIDEIEKYK